MRIFQVDAFTQVRFTGNPATVILDADGAAEGLLAQIAREYSHAEAAFVSAGGAADHDFTLRFFNARKEAPFVGHATVAAHAVLLACGRRSLGTCRQRSGTGIIEVTARKPGPDPAAVPVIEFRQTVPDLSPPLPPEAMRRVAAALELPEDRLSAVLPARIARKGSSRLLIPVTDATALAGLAPDHERLIAIGAELGAEGFFVFAPTLAPGESFTDSRMFCPAIGIAEDPVSGNAHAMLAAYLYSAGLLNRDLDRFTGRQGAYLRRPGQVSVCLEFERDALAAVRIGGGAVIVSEGELAA